MYISDLCTRHHGTFILSQDKLKIQLRKSSPKNSLQKQNLSHYGHCLLSLSYYVILLTMDLPNNIFKYTKVDEDQQLNIFFTQQKYNNKFINIH